MYIDASLIVGGALDEERTFNTDEEFDTWFARLKTEDFGDEDAEIFMIRHGHEPIDEDDERECACIQYLTDHRPYWTNRKES